MINLTLEEKDILQTTIQAKIERDLAEEHYEVQKGLVLNMLNYHSEKSLDYEGYVIEKKTKTTIFYDEEIARPILKQKDLWEAVRSIDSKKMKKVISLDIIPMNQVESFTMSKESNPYISITNAKDHIKNKKEV